MIPQTAEYALRAVVWLANHDEVPQTSEQIAKATQVPPRYLYKVLQALTQAELLGSQPGPRGGYLLAQPADEITMLEVVNVVGTLQRIRTCPLDLESHGLELCPLHRELDQAYAQIQTAFSRVTIAQLVNRRAKTPPLCEIDNL